MWSNEQFNVIYQYDQSNQGDLIDQNYQNERAQNDKKNWKDQNH